jgi:hypothetical protein
MGGIDYHLIGVNDTNLASSGSSSVVQSSTRANFIVELGMIIGKWHATSGPGERQHAGNSGTNPRQQHSSAPTL